LKRGDKINFVRYADDFICTASSKEILEQRVQTIIVKFLRERGLELSIEKTKITHIDEGFDFLGFNLRKYKGKILIKPAKKGIKAFLEVIRETIHSMRAVTTEELILALNPKIQGWANHFRRCVAKKIFSYTDTNIFKAIWKWAKDRHSNKNASWVRNKYFTGIGLRNWCFLSGKTVKAKSNNRLTLAFASNTSIKKYVKVIGDVTPHDPDYQEYFRERVNRQRMERKHSRATHQ